MQLKDGLKALETMMKWQGMLKDEVQVNMPDGVIVLPTEVPVGTPVNEEEQIECAGKGESQKA